jgi:hypothetical protein
MMYSSMRLSAYVVKLVKYSLHTHADVRTVLQYSWPH